MSFSGLSMTPSKCSMMWLEKNNNKNTELLTSYRDLSKVELWMMKTRAWKAETSLTLCPEPCFCPVHRDHGQTCVIHLLQLVAGLHDSEHTVGRTGAGVAGYTLQYTHLSPFYTYTHTQKDTQREWMSKSKLSCTFLIQLQVDNIHLFTFLNRYPIGVCYYWLSSLGVPNKTLRVSTN